MEMFALEHARGVRCELEISFYDMRRVYESSLEA